MPCWKAPTKRILSIHTLGSLSHTRLYAMDMDLFKQAAAVACQLPTRILRYTLLPLTQYFIEISFLFSLKNILIHMVTSYVVFVKVGVSLVKYYTKYLTQTHVHTKCSIFSIICRLVYGMFFYHFNVKAILLKGFYSLDILYFDLF